MSKYYGTVGYAETVETSPDVWQETIVERHYICEVLRNTKRYEPAQYLNDDLTVDVRISIVADPYAYEHFKSIRYVVWMDSKWRVKPVEVAFPRLILTIGGLYHEQDEA